MFVVHGQNENLKIEIQRIAVVIGRKLFVDSVGGDLPFHLQYKKLFAGAFPLSCWCPFSKEDSRQIERRGFAEKMGVWAAED